MSLFMPGEWAFTEKALDLITTNPFEPNWSEKGQTLLGLPPRDAPKVIAWRPGVDLWGPRSVYSEELDKPIFEMAERLRGRLQEGARPSNEELSRYELVSLYCLYCEHGRALDEMIDAAVRGRKKGAANGKAPRGDKPPRELWEGFLNNHKKWFGFGRLAFPWHDKPQQVFAWFFAFRRAFYHIFFNIVGFSKPIAKLRSRVWESIFTHDFLGWMLELHEGMKDFPTLITGPSGTGKERVAEAVGRSAYIPFDPEKKTFQIDFLDAFNPVNLAALPPLLIESELFGHVKGAFASAIRDRIGRLEECPEQGAVFLDEIGEATQDIQVKLLRVLQERRFERVGENKPKAFHGRIIAATNRDLDAEVQAGRFREDFYYRLCADQIETPSLRAQLADRPDDLPFFVEFVCRAIVGEDRAAGFAQEVVGWIERNLPGYVWPGNFRELEQCIRSYTIRKEYYTLRLARQPANESTPPPAPDPLAEACDALAAAVLKGKATGADETEPRRKGVFRQIKRRLFASVCARTRTKREAAALLGVDVRTL